MDMSSSPLVTVIIPVKNGGQLLRECLSAVFAQRTDFPFEVLCIDSGSQDDSLEILRSFPIRLMSIEPASFGHGRTRNLGVEHSHSPFVAFITQDAVPADDTWLSELLAPLREHTQVAGVFGRHVPHPDCIPSDAYMLERHFAGFGQDTQLVRIEPGPEGWAHYAANRSFYRFFSDNNAALRRSVWEHIPYRDVEFMEDQLWATDILEAGYTKAYAPRATVRHSHNYSPWTQARRAFDEARFHRAYFDEFHLPGLRTLLRDKLGQSLEDVRRLARDDAHSAKVSMSGLIVGRAVGQALGWFLGDRHELLPEGLVRRFSQHHSLKGDTEASTGHASPLEDVRRQWRQIHSEHGPLSATAGLTRKVLASWRKHRHHGLSWTLLDLRRELGATPGEEDPWWDVQDYRLLGLPPVAPPEPDPSRPVDPHHLVINWVIPPFSRGGGGHMTIFRTIQLLERMGHSCRVYIADGSGPPEMNSPPVRLRALVHEWYLPIAAPVRRLEGEMEPADVVIATAWSTAYAVRASRCAPARVYFIQDYEPSFYAVGAEWQFAEDTYRFGFYALTAGTWLERMMHERYGMYARSFPLAVEHERYYPEPRTPGARRRLFAYMRPHTTRRGFELTALALRRVNQLHPEVEIHIAGSSLEPETLPFPFVGHGVLDTDGLRRLFSSCDASLCVSFTNYSLLPQELAACGCPVVDIDVESTRASYPPGAVVLAPPDVEGIAHALCQLLEDEPHRQRQIAAGFRYVRELSWEKSVAQAAEALQEFALHSVGVTRARPGRAQSR